MASVNVSDLSKQEKDELAVSYAALMLHDDGLEITVSIIKLIFKLFHRVTFIGFTVLHIHIQLILTCFFIIGREISQGLQRLRKRC